MLPALEALAFHWGDAYLFSYFRDRWVALRRDNRRSSPLTRWPGWGPRSRLTTRTTRCRTRTTRLTLLTI